LPPPTSSDPNDCSLFFYENEKLQVPLDPDEFHTASKVADRIERAVAISRYVGKRKGWSEVQVFNAAARHINTQWYEWDRVHSDWGTAWNGWIRDWHKLRQHFTDLPDFRRPIVGNIPLPAGTHERETKEWLKREIKWADEARRAELFVEIHGGENVLH
jgi:hypothetical protein